MMPDRVIVEEAEQFLEDEWASARESRGVACTIHPLAYLLPKMLSLLEERHVHSIQDLSSAVRELIAEAVFDDVGPQHGHSTDLDAAGCVMIDREVQLYLRVLERVRRTAVRSGQWSDLPVTPQMFG